MNRWRGSTNPTDKTGVATFEIDGRQVDIPLQEFSHYHAILRLIEVERKRSLKAQATFLNGAINRLFEQAP